MDTLSAYKEKMAAQLKEWEAQIDVLEAKIETLGADMRLKHSAEIEKLRAKQQAIAEKMQELGNAGNQAWTETKLTADKLWADLKAGVAEIRDKF